MMLDWQRLHFSAVMSNTCQHSETKLRKSSVIHWSAPQPDVHITEAVIMSTENITEQPTREISKHMFHINVVYNLIIYFSPNN